jgi:peptide/nickel transport system substrate-binding protein
MNGRSIHDLQIKAWRLGLRLLLASMLLAACAPTINPTPIVTTAIANEKVETGMSTPVVEKVITATSTQVVEKVEVATPTPVVEKAITDTPPPVPTIVPITPVSPAFKNPDTYMIVSEFEPHSLDPGDLGDLRPMTNIYEGLVWYNRDKDNEFIPALATGWTSSSDGLTWTFTIREGVTFHEGGTLEPHDVAYTLWRSILHGKDAEIFGITYEAFFGRWFFKRTAIKDFSAAYLGKEKFEDVTPAERVKICEDLKARIVADDEAGTVTFHLAQPTPWILQLTAIGYMGMIVDQEWMVRNGDWDGNCKTWAKWADPPVEKSLLYKKANGTGPYKLDHWTPGKELVLVANENYWRTEPMWEGGPSGAPQIKRVVIKHVSEWDTRLAMFEAGDADYITVPAERRTQLYPYAREYCSADGLTCQQANPLGYIRVFKDLPAPGMIPIFLNWQINAEGGNPYIGSGALDGNGIPPDFFSDIHIRKAFNYCFDFQAMIKSGESIQPQGPIPLGMMGSRAGEPPLYSYDIVKCAQEFKLADVNKDGKPAGADPQDVWDKGFFMLIPYTTETDLRYLVAENLNRGLQAVNPRFQVQAQATDMSSRDLQASIDQRKLPVYLYGWAHPYHDPAFWASTLLASNNVATPLTNMTKEYQARYDDLIMEGNNETDPGKRRSIYETIQLAAQEDAVNIWMYQRTDMIPVQLWIKGLYYNPAYGLGYGLGAEAYAWVYALSKEAP